MAKSPDAFRTISEVAEWLGVQAHVLRFWESKFTHVKPVKRAGGRRYYRPADMLLLGGIKKLLHDDGMTIKGVQKVLREQGVGFVSDHSSALDDLTVAQLDSETGSTPKSSDVPVVEFQSRSEVKGPESPETPVEVPAPAAEPVAETTPEPVSAKVEVPEPLETFRPSASDQVTPRSPSPSAPEPDTEQEQPSALPSFMHKPAVEPETEIKKPRIVAVPDDPIESEIEVSAGLLAHSAALRKIPVSQINAIQAAYNNLETLNARMSGTRKE